MAYTFKETPFIALQKAFDAEIAHHGLIVDDGWICVSEAPIGMNGFRLKIVDRQEIINAGLSNGQLIGVKIKVDADDTDFPKNHRVKILKVFAKEFFKHTGNYLKFRHAPSIVGSARVVDINPAGIGLIFENPLPGVTYSGPGHDLNP